MPVRRKICLTVLILIRSFGEQLDYALFWILTIYLLFDDRGTVLWSLNHVLGYLDLDLHHGNAFDWPFCFCHTKDTKIFFKDAGSGRVD